jgi:hypothetical protein
MISSSGRRISNPWAGDSGSSQEANLQGTRGRDYQKGGIAIFVRCRRHLRAVASRPPARGYKTSGTPTQVRVSPRDTSRRIWEAAGLPSPTPPWRSRLKIPRSLPPLNRRASFCSQPGFSAHCWYQAACPESARQPEPFRPATKVLLSHVRFDNRSFTVAARKHGLSGKRFRRNLRLPWLQ